MTVLAMETYYGIVRTPADAIKLFEACRLGLLPRVQRRLSEKERGGIRSGSVFVWDEREAGMRRWTDGKSWSASRVSGSFLTYREMEGKRNSGFGGTRRGAGKTPESGRGSDEDRDNEEPEGYRYKVDGLLKQSFSITTSAGQHLHLISYYSRPPGGAPELPQPTQDPALAHVVPAKGLYPESSLHDSNPTPALTRAPMANSGYTLSQPTAYAYGHHTGQYSQGYAWPPSPAATPPYSHHVSYPPHSAAPPSQHSHRHLPLPTAEPRTTLPPISHSTSPPMPPIRAVESPRSHHQVPTSFTSHLQYSHHSAGSDHSYPHSSRAPILPPVSIPPHTYSSTTSPPSRTDSISPPRSSHSLSDTNKASLHSILHITPSALNGAGSNISSETSSARTGSTGGSPRSLINNGGRLPPIPQLAPYPMSGIVNSADYGVKSKLDRVARI